MEVTGAVAAAVVQAVVRAGVVQPVGDVVLEGVLVTRRRVRGGDIIQVDRTGPTHAVDGVAVHGHAHAVVHVDAIEGGGIGQSRPADLVALHQAAVLEVHVKLVAVGSKPDG